MYKSSLFAKKDIFMVLFYIEMIYIIMGVIITMTKQEFDTALEAVGLSRKDFAELSGVSYLGTVTNWNDEKRPIPVWVNTWLENYAYRKKYEALRNLIGDKI